MFLRLVPKDFWISRIVRADLAIAVHNRIACIASEGNSVVCAGCNALHLFLRVAVKGRIDQHQRILSPSPIVVVIDQTATGPW